MKLLFITPQLPYPPHQGTTIRNYNLIRYLAMNHTVDLISFTAPREALDESSPLHELCRRIVCIPQPKRSTTHRIRDTFFSILPDMGHRLESKEMRAAIQNWLDDAEPNEWDFVQVEGIEVAQYGQQIVAGFAERFPNQPGLWPQLIFDNHNCEYLLQKRNALNDLALPRRWPAAIYSVLQWQKLRRYERRICQSSTATVAVSVADKEALLKVAPQADVTVVYNGFDPPGRDSTTVESQSDTRANILFIGKMDYRPNVDAMLWFGQSIFPLIRTHMPDVTLSIVGMNPHRRLNALSTIEGIDLVGAVADLEPYLHRAAVYVIPLRVGGGTRFKALEAMAYAKPIVATDLGVEGIPVVDGKELLLANNEESFADAVVQLLEERKNGGATNHTLGENAYQLVINTFTWSAIIPVLESVYKRHGTTISMSDAN